MLLGFIHKTKFHDSVHFLHCPLFSGLFFFTDFYFQKPFTCRCSTWCTNQLKSSLLLHNTALIHLCTNSSYTKAYTHIHNQTKQKQNKHTHTQRKTQISHLKNILFPSFYLHITFLQSVPSDWILSGCKFFLFYTNTQLLNIIMISKGLFITNSGSYIRICCLFTCISTSSLYQSHLSTHILDGTIFIFLVSSFLL